MNNTHISHAKKLIIGAWIVEVLAFSIGIAIAFLNIENTRLNLVNPSTIALIISALPFLMVSVVELTKIPFAYSFYTTKSYFWKSIFGITLLLLMFITFETMMNGFENNFANINQTIQDIRNTITDRENKITKATKNINSRQQNLQVKKQELLNIENTIQNIKVQDSKINNSVLITEISNIETKINALKSERKEEENNASNRINLLKNDIKNIEKDKAIALNRRDAAIDKNDSQFFGSILEKNKIKDIKKALNNYDKEINSIKIDIKEKKRRIAILVDKIKNKIDVLIKNKEIKHIAKIKNDRFTQKTKVQKIKEQQEKYKKRKEYVEKLDSQVQEFTFNGNKKINDLQNEIAQIKLKIIEKSRGIQIYRLTLLWYSDDCLGSDISNCKIVEDITDLTKEQIGFIASLWFGSLAAIASWTGVLLALAGFYLRNNNENSKNKLRFIRRVITLFYKRSKTAKTIIKEKEVIKEVPVDRVVEKEVIKEVPVDKVVFKEVPKEVIRKEYVHVPLYTNDKNLLKFSNSIDIKDEK